MAAAQAYLKSGETFDMSAPELNRLLYPVDTTTGISRPTGRWGAEDVPFFLDVRVDDTYLKGHLCGAQHIIYTDVFKKENLEKLPQDKQIMVYDETGHIGGMVTAALNLLGYDAINLKHRLVTSVTRPGFRPRPI
jgi:rhodanese-related sulfurtransferase